MICRDTNIRKVLKARQRGFLMNPYSFGGGAAPATDPYFANVVLLLHANGTNGSTVFTDSSSYARAITAVGNAQISTANSKFSGASALFDGVGDYAVTAVSADLQIFAGDFTMELWAYYATTVGNCCLIEIGNPNTNRASISIVSGGLYFYTETSGGGGLSRIVVGTAPVINAWHHLAVARSGATTTMYADGVSVGTTATTIFPNTGNLLASIGSNRGNGGSTSDFAGYIDDMRITKSIARYTANFTPPTTAFPNSA